MFVDNYLPSLGDQYDGGIIEGMRGCRFDPGLRKPYHDPKSGVPCVTINTGRQIWNQKTATYEPERVQKRVQDIQNTGLGNPVLNATTLRKDEWILLDTAVVRESRQRLRAWTDLAAANTFGGFNGMAKTVLEHETQSDVGQVRVDMDGLSEGRADRPHYQLEGLPLPITHCDFWFSERDLAVSRNSGTPLDTTTAEMAARRVAEQIEQTTIGIVTGMAYGVSTGYSRTSQVYGYTNFPNRNTKTDLTTPLGTNPDATLADVLAMRELAYADNFYGPFMLYHSTDWDQWMDNDYYAGTHAQGLAGVSGTLRSRIRQIDGITDVRRLDFLTSTYTLLLVQMTSEVARAVVGMDVTTVQWESMGGMRKNFKVMAIMVPQIRSTFAGRCGIVHGTTA